MWAVNRPRTAFVLDERLLAVLSLLQFHVDVLDRFAQRPVLDVVDQQLQDLVERKLLPDQVGADADERHDLRRGRLHLEVEESLLDARGRGTPSSQGFLDLRLRERLLLAGDGLFRSSLDLVQERGPLEDLDELEFPLHGELLRLFSGRTAILRFDHTLDGLPRKRDTFDPIFHDLFRLYEERFG